MPEPIPKDLKAGETFAKITHIDGSGNSSGGFISTGIEITHQVTPSVYVSANGNATHSRSFGHGGRGYNSGGGGIGIGIRF